MRHPLSYALSLLVLSLVACGAPSAELPDATPAATATTLASTAEPTTPPAPQETAAPSLVIRPGAEYVLLLPREAAVPADWAMNPPPSYETRRPQPGDTYRFACLDLTSRAVGQAAVGYRHLEGMPSLHIEYVIYPTDEAAAAALADMERAVSECPTFSIGQGDGAVAAAFSPLAFPAYGDGGFAAVLATDSDVTGSLVTHMIKIRRGHVVIGVNHGNYAVSEAPDAALTESLVALAVGNLTGGPAAPGE